MGDYYEQRHDSPRPHVAPGRRFTYGELQSLAFFIDALDKQRYAGGAITSAVLVIGDNTFRIDFDQERHEFLVEL